jgi:hypothetical protein
VLTLVRFLTVPISATGTAGRMGITYLRGLRVRLCIRLRNPCLLWRHWLTICGRGVIGTQRNALGKREAGRPEKNSQRCASREKTIYDHITVNG